MPRPAPLKFVLSIVVMSIGLIEPGAAPGCSRQPAAPAPITPPTAWGPVIEDKTTDWSGAMAGSTGEVVEAFVEQYRGFSKTTQVEEKSAHHAVIRFDFADLVRGMAREAGTEPPSASGKPLNRRLLIEVTPSGKDFAVRLRSFNISG